LKRIKDIPDFDRPREKLADKGPEALSDTELLAVLLGSGVRGKHVFQVARSILKKIDTNKKSLDVAKLVSIEGVGFARACQILASLEFAKRRSVNKETVIRNTRDVLPLISYIADRKQEYFICLSLSGANQVIGNRVVTMGLVNKNQIHPREVFVDAITDRAASVILAHNHPSGILNPSPDDILATRQLVDAGKIIGISVLDHIIITRKGFLSLKEEGYFQ
jgi:DNA repair protein RadC